MVVRLSVIELGKIVRSESHVRYTCQIYSAGEIATPPKPADFAFGAFVRMPLRMESTRTPLAPGSRNGAPAPRDLASTHATTWAVGLIYDTILVNPAFGSLGPRLSSADQLPLFSPDYLNERAVLVSILLLGTMSASANGETRVAQGVPPVAPDLGAVVAPLSESDVRAFHHFADGGAPGGAQPYLHMGYLPHAIALDNPLLPLAMLRTVERLEILCPENSALLTIVKRNLAWRLKVEATG